MDVTDKVKEMIEKVYYLASRNETTVEHELHFIDEYYMNERYELPNWFEVVKGLAKVQLEENYNG